MDGRAVGFEQPIVSPVGPAAAALALSCTQVHMPCLCSSHDRRS